MTILPAATLTRRELVRFIREKSRMIGVIASPIVFWGVIGSGLSTDMTYLEYFFPGSVILIVLFAAIFSSISVIEDRKEGFLQSVLVAPVSRWSIVLGKVAGITLLSLAHGSFRERRRDPSSCPPSFLPASHSACRRLDSSWHGPWIRLRAFTQS